MSLPEDHEDVLRIASGISACHGYFRLFGLGCSNCTDLVSWNDMQTWKFAWPGDLEAYLSFGETGWGDQYCYRLDELSMGDASVFLLDAFEMQAERIASGFSEFMHREFIRQAEEPYDSMTRQALAGIGPLSWSEHVTFIPPLLFGIEEDIGHVHKTDARAAMTVNGDIAREMREESGRVPESLQTYEDEKGRIRVHVRWRA